MSELEIEVLKSLAASHDAWAEWATFAVFLGLLGEIAIVFMFTKDKTRREIILSAICAAIIAFGVFGEWIFGSRAARENAQLQSISERKVADLNVEAGNARKEAGSANERAGKAIERAAQANQKAEAEHLARVKLEAHILPKFLSDKDLQGITDDCRPFSKSGVKILIETSEGFSFSLGLQVDAALNKAGFPVEFRHLAQAWYGISVAGPVDHWDVFIAVVKAIAKPLPFTGILEGLPPGSPITIRIGEKLISPLPEPEAATQLAGPQKKVAKKQNPIVKNTR